jgi:superoxide dismutase, Fe-Mn family
MHTLPKLPYEYDGLEPHIDKQTMMLHHSKHHQGYVDKLNEILKDYPDLEKLSVEDLLINFNKVPKEIKEKIKFFAGGVANHNLFWKILSPKGGGYPAGVLGEAINKEFGSWQKMQEKFNALASSQFGSGWTWLVVNRDNKLELFSTLNHDSPLLNNKKPILLIDMWEHAFYLKHQNKKADYLKAFWQVVNVKAVEERYEKVVE